VPKRKIKLFTHQDFRDVFFNQEEVSTNCRRMQSIKHVVYNVEQQKIALSYADDKRAWYSNNFSLPYGYRGYEWFKAIPPPDIVRNCDDDDDDDDGEPTIKKTKIC